MKNYVFLMAIAMVSLMGCGVWDDHPPCGSCTTCDPRTGCTKPTCGEGQTFITHETYQVDKTADFLGGLICVKSNMVVSFIIRDDLDSNFEIKDVTGQDECLLLGSSSYTISFSSVDGYKTPPSVKKLQLQVGDKYTVNGQYAHY